MKSNRIIPLLFVLSFMLIVFQFSSCTDGNSSFTEEESKVIDSLYNLRKKEIKNRLDTICDSVYQMQFPIIVDSIKAIRKKEILDLLGK